MREKAREPALPLASSRSPARAVISNRNAVVALPAMANLTEHGRPTSASPSLILSARPRRTCTAAPIAGRVALCLSKKAGCARPKRRQGAANAAEAQVQPLLATRRSSEALL